jgi:uncharacterized membrane protein YhaH (DUF805 family)
MTALLLTIFGVRRPVTRPVYVGAGAVLLLLKFALETALVHGSLGRSLTVAEFLTPFYVHRATVLAALPGGVAWGLVALHLPFLWIGLSMSARRAVDAGLKPWWGFLFILPWVQYALIAALSILPHKSPKLVRTGAQSPFRTNPHPAEHRSLVPSHATLFRLLRATFLGCAVSLGMLAIMLEWTPNHWILAPLPAGAFVAGAVATRTRAPHEPRRPTPLRTLAYGVALVSLFPFFIWIGNGLPRNMGVATLFPLVFVFIAPSVLYGLFLSGWSVGTTAGLIGAELDRHDLDGTDQTRSSVEPQRERGQ